MPKGKGRVKKIVERELRSVVLQEDKEAILEELQNKIEKQAESRPAGRVPGMTLGSTKVTYTYQDLKRMFPIVTFTPEETITLTFQGVPVQAYADREMHVPECFKQIYDQHRREQRINTKQMQDLGIVVDLGVGAF